MHVKVACCRAKWCPTIQLQHADRRKGRGGGGALFFFGFFGEGDVV